MKIKVFEAFAGYGSQSLALERLKQAYPDFDYEVVGISEIDKYAIQAYNTLHPNVHNYGDISKIDWNQVPDFDLLTYSFPCGLKGTMVKTIDGYKKIEDIQEREMVATHNNRYRPVVKTMTRLVKDYYEIKGVGCQLKLTDEHPLYVLRNGIEQWVKVKDLQLSDMLSYCIPTETKECLHDNKLLWLLGRYVADGFINKRHYNSVAFAIGKKKEEEFLNHIPSDMKDKFKRYDKSCYEYRIADLELKLLCSDFGNGAINKKLPEWIYTLPNDKIDAFLEGYIAGDGFIRYRSSTKVLMFTTVSKELFLGLQRLIMKRYNKVCSLYIRVDNRKETFNDNYSGQIAFTPKTNQIKRDDRIFVPIKKIEKITKDVQVFNFEVEEDNSYTCDNVNTHNCTDISSVGQQKGLAKDSGTRSSLLWECEKAIEIKRPKFLLMENVSALVEQKFIKYFHEWHHTLERYGYSNFSQVMNAKDYGVPQNRERIFMVSILGDAQYFFPQPFKSDKRLKDVLEQNVDERYYLSDKTVQSMRDHCERKQAEGCGFKFEPTDGGGIAKTISTLAGNRETDNFIQEE